MMSTLYSPLHFFRHCFSSQPEVTPAYSGDQSTRTRLQTCISLRNRGQIQELKKELQTLFAEPEHQTAEAYHAAGILLTDHMPGQPVVFDAQGLDYLETAVKLGTDNPNVLQRIGDLYMQKSYSSFCPPSANYTKAEQAYLSALAVSSEKNELLQRLSAVYRMPYFHDTSKAVAFALDLGTNPNTRQLATQILTTRTFTFRHIREPYSHIRLNNQLGYHRLSSNDKLRMSYYFYSNLKCDPTDKDSRLALAWLARDSSIRENLDDLCRELRINPEKEAAAALTIQNSCLETVRNDS